MKLTKVVLLIFLTIVFSISTASAGDFDWYKDMNVKAEADSSGFRLRIASRFKIGDTEVKAVFSNVDRPADAYMVFRLGEISGRSTNEVVRLYQENRHKGWGVIAKRLGIKPGSAEFHALKRGHDLDGGRHKNVNHEMVKSKGNGKQKNNKGKKHK